jgi:multicomponent Na+:H+ antiporter subunit D
VVAVLVLLSSLLAVIYVGRVVEAMYFGEPPEGAEPVTEAPWSILVPTWVLAGATIYFGLSTSWTAAVAEHAAKLLFEGRL